MAKQYDCAVIGDWHLAFVTAGVLSSLGKKVLLVNPQPSPGWANFPELPVIEPGLQELFDAARARGDLAYANGVSDAWSAKFVWMAIDTPVNHLDEADVNPLLAVAEQVARHQPKLRAFILNSQIPIGFCARLRNDLRLPVIYIPENLRLGKGIETLLRADRTVIGAAEPALGTQVQQFLSGFQTEFLLCNLETSEMVKHANNAFLAMSISFANELARLGERFDVDGQTVAKALKLDKRIGPGAYVAPGLGFAGGTLPRDIRTLQKTGKAHQIPMRIMDAVMDVNEDTTQSICEMVTAKIDAAKAPGRVLILGYTYKADTDTLRRSLSLDIAAILKKKGYVIEGFDPVMNERDLSPLAGLIEHHASLDSVRARPDIVLVMTARPAFREIDWARLGQAWKLEKNARTLLVDTQNFLDQRPILAAHLDFKRIWCSVQNAH